MFPNMFRPLGALFLLVLVAGGLGCTRDAGDSGASEDASQEGAEAVWQTWHEERTEELLAPDGWMTLVGLHWLEPGRWSVGTDEASDLQLEAKGALLQAPSELATLVVSEVFEEATEGALERSLRVLAEPANDGVQVVTSGEPGVLFPYRRPEPGSEDASSWRPPELSFGAMVAMVIERGGHLALRVRDRSLDVTADFHALEHFPYAPQWRLEGRFFPAPQPREVDVPNVTPPLQPTVRVHVLGDVSLATSYQPADVCD